MSNKLILGTVQFGLKYGINNTIGKPKKNEVLNLLKFAYNSGIRVLDTAEAYGNAHQLIGNYHKKQDKFLKFVTDEGELVEIRGAEGLNYRIEEL